VGLGYRPHDGEADSRAGYRCVEPIRSAIEPFPHSNLVPAGDPPSIVVHLEGHVGPIGGNANELPVAADLFSGLAAMLYNGIAGIVAGGVLVGVHQLVKRLKPAKA
jgi:hypothetical protein